jgi:demethylmenaquinone methyltransferase/2-methoxy-6-polyprenyl-1,4-benzoquinol methylase
LSAQIEDAQRLYAHLAERYDEETRLITGIRRRAVHALALLPGETVLDAGCGTGWCLPMLAQCVGEQGRVIGFEPSPQMIAIAHSRVRQVGLKTASLMQASGDSVKLPVQPDAILFSYTHDLLQSRDSLENIFRQARAGTRVVAVGTKLFPAWFAPGNWYLRFTHRQTITNFRNFDAPWRTLSEFCNAYRVRSTVPGSRYLFEGTLG